jgi:hypothetical protein
MKLAKHWHGHEGLMLRQGGIDPELGVDSKLIGFGTPCAPPTQPGLVAVEEPAEVAKISVIRPIQ